MGNTLFLNFIHFIVDMNRLNYEKESTIVTETRIWIYRI